VRELPGRVLDQHLVKQEGTLLGVGRLGAPPPGLNLPPESIITVHPEPARDTVDSSASLVCRRVMRHTERSQDRASYTRAYLLPCTRRRY
jgi:hypothetical protein